MENTVSRFPYRPINAPIMRTSRHVSLGVLTSTSAANGFYGFVFQISQVNDVSSFANLYDAYRISRIDLLIRAMSQPMLPGSTASYANLLAAIDIDDGNPPSSQGEVLDYSNCQILAPGQNCNLSFVPRIAVGAYNGSVNPAMNAVAPWIDMTYTTVQHYGFKVCVTQSTSTNVSNWFLFARYHLEFKSSR